MKPDDACPCGSGLAFAGCCNVYLSGSAQAPNAASLMRSRYTAYALRDAAYVLKSWHVSTRPRQLDLSEDKTRWLELTIIDADDEPGVDHAEVEFTARFFADGQPQTLHECSTFVKENGAWFYVDGHARWVLDAKPGRNDPCPCGSGKKHKKCCG